MGVSAIDALLISDALFIMVGATKRITEVMEL